MKTRPLVLLLVAALIVALAASALYTVDESERAIVTRFGKPLEGVRGPGLHVKAPWPIDEVLPVDARLLVFDGEPTEMLTADKKNVLVDAFIVWRVADPLAFVRTLGTRLEAEARLLDVSSSAIGAALGREPITSFISTDPKALRVAEVSEAVRARIDGEMRGAFGIEIVDLQINGFSFPAQNRASVIDRMRAERSRIATGYRSEGEERALEIEARAEAERERLLSEARAKAEALLGEGEAEALSILAEAYRRDPELYRFLRTLEAYERILDEDTTIFIEGDSRLMQTLHDAR